MNVTAVLAKRGNSFAREEDYVCSVDNNLQPYCLQMYAGKVLIITHCNSRKSCFVKFFFLFIFLRYCWCTHYTRQYRRRNCYGNRYESRLLAQFFRCPSHGWRLVNKAMAVLFIGASSK